MSTTTNDNKTLIFVYGTLKRNCPNHHLLESFTTSNDATFIGNFRTINPYPLVHGPLGIPFLLNKPGFGCRVKGELYSVSDHVLAQLDVLEGVEHGHYDRLPIVVKYEDKYGSEDGEVKEVETYFAGWKYGEEMWEKSGKKGFEEYLLSDGENYVGVDGKGDGFGMKEYLLLWTHPFNYHNNNVSRL